jgi:tetratricopeptide (TPR) repeat protein
MPGRFTEARPEAGVARRAPGVPSSPGSPAKNMASRRKRHTYDPAVSRSPAPRRAAVAARPESTRPWWQRPLVSGSLLFALALAVRTLYCLTLRDSPFFTELIGDGVRYDAWARELAAGDWIGSEVFYQAPLYPYFLGVVYAVAGADLMIVRGVQALLGASACVLLFAAGRRFFGAAVGLVAGTLLAVYPPAIFYDGLVEKSSLDLWLVTVMLASMGAFLARRHWPWLLLLGLALGALTLNRENARVLVAVLAPWLLIALPDAPWRRRVAWAGLFVAAFGAALLPVAWRNHHVGGEWFVSTSQLGPNFYIGNHAGSRGVYDPLVPGRGDARVEQLDATRLAEEALGRSLSPGEVSDYWLGRTIDDIRDGPLRWLRLLAWKLLLVFHDVELTDSVSLGAFATDSALLRGLSWGLGLGVVLPFAAFGLWATRREWRRLAVLYAMLAVLASSVTLFFVFARYRYPMIPVLLLFAGAGLCALPGMLRGLGRPAWLRLWAPGVAAAAGVAILAHWPLPDGYRDDHITFYNAALKLDERERRDEALAYLGRALEIEPRFGLAYFHRGRLLADMGRDADAARDFALAVRFVPEVPDTHYRYGLLLAQRMGRLEEGIMHLRRAVAMLPDSAPARIELALALGHARDIEGTRQESEAALRLAPDAWAVANNLAWLLATHPEARHRDGAEAVRWAERAVAAAGDKVPVPLLDTLAAAQAEAGRFDLALATIDRALALAAGDDEMVRELEARRALFAAGTPFREAAEVPPSRSTP